MPLTPVAARQCLSPTGSLNSQYLALVGGAENTLCKHRLCAWHSDDCYVGIVDVSMRVCLFWHCAQAGSERVKDTLTSGDTLKEASNINRSLFALGKARPACMDRGLRHVIAVMCRGAGWNALASDRCLTCLGR